MWSRLQSGKIPFEPQYLNFNDICSEVTENLKLNAISKNISLNFFTAEAITVFADINMLKTILRNLTSNAIKFTNHGGQVNIFAELNNSNTLITVSDNGVGIKADILNELFDFSKIRTSEGTDNEKGTGLGLLLCKEFVEKHSGEIWVESEKGVGSEFKILLPNGPK